MTEAEVVTEAEVATATEVATVFVTRAGTAVAREAHAHGVARQAEDESHRLAL